MLSVLYIIILKEVVHVERFVFLACIASSGRDSSRSQFRFVASQQFRHPCQPAVDVLHHRIVEVCPLNPRQCPGGLLAVFVVFIVLFMAGVNQWLCIGFIVSASLLLVWQTFRLNAKYGTHGLMKAAARKRHPRFIISRKAIPRLFNYKRRKEERT